MSLFLLKPHVTGPEGAVTSPDVIVDRLFVDGAPVPVGLLTHEAWQQAAPGTAGQAAYALMALGGGALMLPAVRLGTGPIVVARKAWRLANLAHDGAQVKLNGVALSQVAPPADAVASAGGEGDALPRGVMVLRTAQGDTTEATLDDPDRGRSLAFRVALQDVGADPWGPARPRPRYAVGPTQKDVTHYI